MSAWVGYYWDSDRYLVSYCLGTRRTHVDLRVKWSLRVPDWNALTGFRTTLQLQISWKSVNRVWSTCICVEIRKGRPSGFTWRCSGMRKCLKMPYILATSGIRIHKPSFRAVEDCVATAIGCIILIIKANKVHNFSDLFDKVLYMFRTGPLSIIRSISTLYIRNRYLSC